MTDIKIVRKPRYDGRAKKRQWEERRSDKGAGLEGLRNKVIKTETKVTEELLDKIKRRKFAILLGYSGTNYFGMQRNPGTATIEEALLKSLHENNYISEENFVQVQTMQFQRAARTDRGVSAVRQIVSLKLPENVEVAKLNEKLPEDIRVFDLQRVTKGFNSKSQCDSRSYFYLLPTVAFVPKDVFMVQKGHRIAQETLDKISEVLQKFHGTKNFHNFTSKKQPMDPSAKRFMKSLTYDKPFVKDDVEFTIIKIRGQSFMLHQIRKMIGLLLAVVKGLVGEDIVDTAFSNEKVNIPRAPGLGLALEFVHYDRYDNRYGSDGMHTKLTWENVENDVIQFRDKYVLPTILDKEIKEEEFINWIIRKLTQHGFADVEGEDEEEEEEKSDSEGTNKTDR